MNKQELVRQFEEMIGEGEVESFYLGIGTSEGDGTIDEPDAIARNQLRRELKHQLHKLRSEVLGGEKYDK